MTTIDTPKLKAAARDKSGLSLQAGPRARALGCLKEWIDNGTLRHGQPLPSERELAEKLQVNRGTLRSALDMLTDEGLVQSNGGRLRIVQSRGTVSRGVLSGTIGVLTVDALDPVWTNRTQGYSHYITYGAMDAIQGSGRHAIALHPDRLERRELAQLAEHQLFGVAAIVKQELWPETAKTVAAVREMGVDVVVYGSIPELALYDRVMSDHEGGTYLLTRWLIEQGRRRILPLWNNSSTGFWFPLRRAGYERAMREAGLEPLTLAHHIRLVEDAPNQQIFNENVRLAAGYLVEYLTGPNAVDAMIAISDGYVPTIISACHLFGKKCHDDVAVVSYDNYWIDAPERQWEPTPPLATMDKQNLRMGSEMVRLLIERKDGLLPEEPQQRLISQVLIPMNDIAL